MSEIIECDTCDQESCIMLWSKEDWVMKIWEELRQGVTMVDCEYKNPSKKVIDDGELQMELFKCTY